MGWTYIMNCCQHFVHINSILWVVGDREGNWGSEPPQASCGLPLGWDTKWDLDGESVEAPGWLSSRIMCTGGWPSPCGIGNRWTLIAQSHGMAREKCLPAPWETGTSLPCMLDPGALRRWRLPLWGLGLDQVNDILALCCGLGLPVVNEFGFRGAWNQAQMTWLQDILWKEKHGKELGLWCQKKPGPKCTIFTCSHVTLQSAQRLKPFRTHYFI